MLLDFEVRTCTRVCAQSGKPLAPGEVYFSVLEVQDVETIRQDYGAEAWQGPPEGNLGWWRSRVPMKDEKPKLAPADVMLNLFSALAEKPADQKFRYVLGLLLVRRRLLRREDTHRNEADQEVLTLFAPKRNDHFELIVDEPNPDQAEQIQQRMIALIYGDGHFADARDQPNSSETEAA